MTNELRLILLNEVKERVEEDLVITKAREGAISIANSVHNEIINAIFKTYHETHGENIVIHRRMFTAPEVRRENYNYDKTLLEWLESHPEEHYYFHLQWGEFFTLIDYDKLIELLNNDANNMSLGYTIETIDGDTYLIIRVTRQAINHAISCVASEITPQKK